MRVPQSLAGDFKIKLPDLIRSAIGQPFLQLVRVLYIIDKQLDVFYFQHSYLRRIQTGILMKVRFVVIGKTGAAYLQQGIAEYTDRLSRYCDLEVDVVADVRNRAVLPAEKLKIAESEQLLRKVNSGDFLVILDENGKEFSSVDFAAVIEKWQVSGVARVVFMIGGAYGFGEDVYKRANLKMSLSRMTFSHQMVRLIFLEQLYRAFTIIRKEPYHHS